jgi:hypothetical protein
MKALESMISPLELRLGRVFSAHLMAFEVFQRLHAHVVTPIA